MTDATVARPPIGLTLRSLLTADFMVLLRSRQTLILNLAVPIVMLIITNQATRRGGAGFGAAGPAMMIALALSYGLLSSALLGYSITVARDREAGVFQRLRVTPTPTWAIMLSRLLVQFAAAIVTAIVVIVVGGIMHGLSYGVGTYLLILAVALYGAAMFLGIGQAVVGLLRSSTAVNALGRVLYVVLLLLGILGISGVLGDTFTNIAKWSPVGALMTLFTAAQGTAAWTSDDGWAIVAVAGYLVVFAGIGIRWFQWEAR
ncbi:ABC transporter permease [Microbacterium gorillae]|uniref:ABC transporter permease n=1 Tax=Microbacterium gorillae TaxID=1231063 RepID=UPI003D95F9D7